MSTITTILEPDADGTLRLPVPEHLRQGKVRVVATMERAPGATGLPMPEAALAALKRLRARGAFGEIADPAAWQREVRKDRPLPGREP